MKKLEQKGIKGDTVEYEALIEVEIYYYELINVEYFNIEHLSPQAEKGLRISANNVINNPEKSTISYKQRKNI